MISLDFDKRQLPPRLCHLLGCHHLPQWDQRAWNCSEGLSLQISWRYTILWRYDWYWSLSTVSGWQPACLLDSKIWYSRLNEHQACTLNLNMMHNFPARSGFFQFRLSWSGKGRGGNRPHKVLNILQIASVLKWMLQVLRSSPAYLIISTIFFVKLVY